MVGSELNCRQGKRGETGLERATKISVLVYESKF